MNSTNWDDRYMEMAKLVAGWSKDPSTQVGAVIVSPDNHVVSVGFNGFPRGIEDNDRLNQRGTKYMNIIHAEMNALMFANCPVKGCVLYTHPFQPCSQCAACIIQSGISKIITKELSNCQPKWYNDFRNARQMFIEANIELHVIGA
jgi:dCMP deaminase